VNMPAFFISFVRSLCLVSTSGNNINKVSALALLLAVCYGEPLGVVIACYLDRRGECGHG